MTVQDFVQRPTVKEPLSRKSPRFLKSLFRRYQQVSDNPLIATGEAIVEGIAISQIDGPLPIADVIGFGWSVKEAGQAWYDHFTE